MRYERIYIKSINKTKLFKISESKSRPRVYVCMGYDYLLDEWEWEEYKTLDEAIMNYVLKIGYKSTQEKLEDWFWGESQEVPQEERKRLIAEERAAMKQQRKEMRKLRRHSKRVMKQYDGIVEVIYKSRRALAKYRRENRRENGVVIIEPVIPNTAAIMVNEADFDRYQVIDLNKVANIRVVHRGKNIEVIRGA